MFELTLDEVHELQKSALDRLVQDAGSPSHLARMLNIHLMTVKGWIERGRVSKDGATLVETHPTLGEHHKAKDLRPDL